MTDTKNKRPKKTTRRSGAKKLARWQQRMLRLEIEAPVVVVLEFNEQGDLRAITLEQAQQDAAQRRAMSAEAIGQVFKTVESMRQKNPQLLSKRAQDALYCLFAWAVMTKQYRYGDWLSPDDQREMLDDFWKVADAGIKRAKFQKAESVIITAAYKFARPFLISYREQRGIPNTESLTPKQGKAAWIDITARSRWAQLVERHVRTSRKRRMEKDGLNIPIERMRKQSDIALRNGINARWEREFPNKNGQK